MMHNARKDIEMPCCFWRSSMKFKGHMKQKIANIVLIWAFPDCNSNLNSLMTMKWCIKLEWHRRGVLLFFNVISEISPISWSRETQNACYFILCDSVLFNAGMLRLLLVIQTQLLLVLGAVYVIWRQGTWLLEHRYMPETMLINLIKLTRPL